MSTGFSSVRGVVSAAIRSKQPIKVDDLLDMGLTRPEANRLLQEAMPTTARALPTPPMPVVPCLLDPEPRQLDIEPERRKAVPAQSRPAFNLRRGQKRSEETKAKMRASQAARWERIRAAKGEA